MENLKDWKTLLEKFKKVPKLERETTFMEVCRFSYMRYEEICSRILAFYLNPTAEHNMRGMMVRVFLKLSGNEELADELEYHPEVLNDIKVWIEEPTQEGKRIDIVVNGPNFVIGIENKINAELYNQLELYRKHIKTFGKENAISIVLSARNLKVEELKKTIDSEHIVIYYSDLFSEIEKEIGKYILTCDHKWLVILQDFIKTIKNLITMAMFSNSEMYRFFSQNQKEIEELLHHYEKYKSEVAKEQTDALTKLYTILREKTNGNWNLWEGMYLYTSFNNNTHSIGIDSCYIADEHGALGKFHYCITTWRAKDWDPYAEAVLEAFPEGTLEERGNRVFLNLPTIVKGSLEEIADKLKEVYQKLFEICGRIK